MGIRLDTDEAWEVINSAHTGILTTLRADGSPVTLPLWFAVLDRTICFTTPSSTQKVGRIRNDPRASFLVEFGAHWAELRAVHLNGLIEEIEDEATRIAIDVAIGEKYASFRTPSECMPDATRHYYQQRSFLRLCPVRMLSWDNSRIRTL